MRMWMTTNFVWDVKPDKTLFQNVLKLVTLFEDDEEDKELPRRLVALSKVRRKKKILKKILTALFSVISEPQEQ